MVDISDSNLLFQSTWLYSSCLLLLKQPLSYEVHLHFPWEQAWDAFPGCDWCDHIAEQSFSAEPAVCRGACLICLTALPNGCVAMPSHAAGCVWVCCRQNAGANISVSYFWSLLKRQVSGLRNTQCNPGILQEERSWKLFPLG